jgi:TolB protein
MARRGENMKIKKIIYKICLSLIILSSVLIDNTYAQDTGIYIKVGEAQIKKSLVAFPDLQFVGSTAANPQYQRVGAELSKVIRHNLEVTDYFNFSKPSSFLEDPAKTAPTPAPDTPNGFTYEKWKSIGVDVLIRISYTIAGDNVSIDTYSYLVPKAQLIFGKKYTTKFNNLHRVAHIYSNDLIKALTGKDGIFLSKIVVSLRGQGLKHKEINLMDWDGFNRQQITHHNSIALSPNWSPTGTQILYTAFVKRGGAKGLRNPDMLMLDLLNSQRWLVSYRRGLNSGGTFHPDGKSIYLTISESGNSDIYQVDLEGNIKRRMTAGPSGALNVEPAPSPDGTKLAFSSDRSGHPMIWVMNADGSNVKRITYAGVYNSSPAWSPDGKRIAFAGHEKDHYDIFIMNADGTNMQRLTSAKKDNGKWSSNEDPGFSPDGRHVMFTSDRTGTNQIYIINVDGNNERRITFDRDSYFKPRWSKNFDTSVELDSVTK